MDNSTKILMTLVFILAVISALNIFMPQGNLLPIEQLPTSKPVMSLVSFIIIFILYSVLGIIGLKLSRKLKFPEILDKKINNKQRFFTPLIIGILIGIFIIIIDLIFSNFNSIGKIPHPPFPTSILASLAAGIGEEIISRLFFISLFTWLISTIILKKQYKNQVFWIVSIASAILFSLGHIPSIKILLATSSLVITPIFIIELLILNGSLSLVAAYYFRKYGYLAAVGIHFWADIIWHVIYPLF